MLALLFTIALFAYWWLLGIALVVVLQPSIERKRAHLIAPSLGIALLLLPVFFLNRFGIPVRSFGFMLAVGLALLALALLLWRRPKMSLEHSGRFLILLLIALVLNGWPMIRNGFDWISYVNDDMANYVLGAQRFLNGGFFQAPDMQAFIDGRNFSDAFWFMHVAGGVRPGSELMIAEIWAATGLNGQQIFMPVMVALYLALMCATSALISFSPNFRRAYLVAAAAMAVSPLTSLGVMYQLIAQVGGLALACSVSVLAFSAGRETRLGPQVGRVATVVVLSSALLVWYPELVPVVALAWVVYNALLLRTDFRGVIASFAFAVCAAAVIALLMNTYLVSAIAFLLTQAKAGLSATGSSDAIFPYFLVPGGLSAFWGIATILGGAEPYYSISVLIGALLFIWFYLLVLPKQLFCPTSAASFVVVLTILAVRLYFGNSDFGLFKLAMYAQPFIIAVIALAVARWAEAGWRRAVAYVLAAVLVIPMLIAQFRYVDLSAGNAGNQLNALPSGSGDGYSSKIASATSKLFSDGADKLATDIPDQELEKLISLYTYGKQLLLPSHSLSLDMVGHFSEYINFDRYPEAHRYISEMSNAYVRKDFKTNNSYNTALIKKDIGKRLVGAPWLMMSNPQTVLNSRYLDRSGPAFVVRRDPKNWLVFVNSTLGNHFYGGTPSQSSVFQMERDPMMPTFWASAIGEHILLMAVGADENPRMVMELSDTIAKQFRSALPSPTVGGIPIGFVGRGSGRLISPPLDPVEVEGVHFLEVEMNREGKRFPDANRSPIMKLYGAEVALDSRPLTAFARDISLISDADYSALIPPSSIGKFPHDLENKSLEYSGVYEDGWLSERSFFKLRSTNEARFLTLRGLVPSISNDSFTTHVTISVDGKDMDEQTFPVGEFEVKLPVALPAGNHRIDLKFDKYLVLPGNDGRPVVGQLQFLGFEEK